VWLGRHTLCLELFVFLRRRNIMHPKDRCLSKNERRVLQLQQNLNYIIGKFLNRKIFMKFPVIAIINVYARKKGITKSFDEAFDAMDINCKNFEYSDIFRELIKLRYIRYVGKKSHWLPNEGVVLTKKGEQWKKQNFNEEDYYL
jgi:hypothetical protein